MPSRPVRRTLPIAVRTYVPPRKRRRPRLVRGVPGLVVVFDTETTIDPSQRLLFGSYRVYEHGRLLEEGLIAADDLSDADRANLDTYADTHPSDAGGRLRVLSRADFAKRIIWRAGYEARALVVGFNLPFDLSRIAVDAHEARNGGFSLVLFDGLEVDGRVRRNLWRPEVTVKADGSRRQFISFTKPPRLDERNLENGHGYRGRFLDLHTLAYALTDLSLGLDGAAAEFGVDVRKSHADHLGVVTPEYIDYNRQDVRTTYALYLALAAEFGRHPVDLDPEQAFSPAAIGKAYLRRMGIRAPLDRRGPVSDADLGHAMTAYFGGRAEARIRRLPMPVRYVDFTSMYPTVVALLGMWRWVIARSFAVVDATEDVRSILATVDREALHRPETWKQFGAVFVRLVPGGQRLPVRAPYGSVDADHPDPAWTLGLAPLRGTHALWYALPDVIASKVLDGVAPPIIEAVRVEPVGRLAGLCPVDLRGSIAVDPSEDDLFRRAIELRHQVRTDASVAAAERARLAGFLKTFANGGAYGVFVEYHQTEPVAAPGTLVQASGLWAIQARARTPEEPGEFCFPPIAASVTAGARLLLAVLQADVEAAGGTYVACDTDSLVIVASRDGGLLPCVGGPYALPDGQAAVRALTWTEVDGIAASINALNPYADGTIRTLLKLEPENMAEAGDTPGELMALAISSKRYVLYNRTPDGPRIRKASTHGLGLFRAPVPNPPGWDRSWPAWVDVLWDRIIREAEGSPLPPEPAWFDQPAVGQLSISAPGILRAFRGFNADRPYAGQVKPFGFVLVGHVDSLVPLPRGVPPGVVPVAPYSTEPDGYLRLPWRAKQTGQALEVITRPGGAPGAVRLRTYRDVFTDYRLHPETKSGDPAGGPGVRSSIGLLPHVEVTMSGVPVHIGKESNLLEEIEAGGITDHAAAYVEYRDDRREWEAALPALRRLRDERGWRYLADASGLSERALRYALNGGMVPRSWARRALLTLQREGESGAAGV